MIAITRKIEFDYGHRVLGHGGKCRHLHGHRGIAEITVSGEALDLLGMVIDFGSVKKIVGDWIDSHWDHRLLLSLEDPQLLHLQATEEQSPYVMANGNPTAENMAKELFTQCQKLLPRVIISRVRIWETPSCSADYWEVK
jgi:6-pyruvoyltetrahydropterin/6-carboxytetrahydropterin synthase